MELERASIDTIDDLAVRPRGARSLLLTMLGEFVYPAGGTVWTSTIVDGLDTVGISEANARQAVARLGEQGIVHAERLGRRTRWHLTERGNELLATGSERIYSFGPGADRWDQRWLLVTCSIPETQRATRRRFRAELTFAGFGFLTPAIAISPHPDREPLANVVITELGLADTAMTFVASTGSLTPDTGVLTAAWDLDAVAGAYAEFLDEFTAPSTLADGDAPATSFGTVLRLVDAWRRFPFIDPELPSVLLPDGWIGVQAHEVFEHRRADERSLAAAWFDAAEVDAS